MSTINPICSLCNRESFAHQIILETTNFNVLYARRPLSHGHCLVVPKKHLSEGLGVLANEGDEFVSLINKLFVVLTKVYGAVGVNFFANFGKSAGQEIPHTHFHIVPRFENESQSPFEKLNNPSLRAKMESLSKDELGEEIAKIRSAL